MKQAKIKNNPVAKYATINKASVHRDKTKYYRKEKHKKSFKVIRGYEE